MRLSLPWSIKPSQPQQPRLSTSNLEVFDHPIVRSLLESSPLRWLSGEQLEQLERQREQFESLSTATQRALLNSTSTWAAQVQTLRLWQKQSDDCLRLCSAHHQTFRQPSDYASLPNNYTVWEVAVQWASDLNKCAVCLMLLLGRLKMSLETHKLATDTTLSS